MAKFRILTVIFALFLVLVAILADTGQVGKVFGFLYNFPEGDKLGHFGLYGMASLLASLSFLPKRITPLRLLRTSLIICGLALLEEISQEFIPGRNASLLDLFAGIAGIFLFGETGVRLMKRFSPNRILTTPN